MENNVSHWLLSQFNQIATYCKELHELLQADLGHFGKNDLKSLGESNIKKTEIFDHLTVIVSDLKKEIVLSNSEDSLLQKAIDKVQRDPEKNQLQSIAHEIKSEIQNCSKFILSNSQVFSKSLQHLKNMWELILSMNKTEIGVYDHTGKVK